jgi:hypothetical protein
MWGRPVTRRRDKLLPINAPQATRSWAARPRWSVYFGESAFTIPWGLRTDWAVNQGDLI